MGCITLYCITCKNLVTNWTSFEGILHKKSSKMGPKLLPLALLTVSKMRTTVVVLENFIQLGNFMSSFILGSGYKWENVRGRRLIFIKRATKTIRNS